MANITKSQNYLDKINIEGKEDGTLSGPSAHIMNQQNQ